MVVSLKLTMSLVDKFLKPNILINRGKKLSQLLLIQQKRSGHTKKCPRHLICFDNWSKDVVTKIITSAMNLKHICENTHQKTMNILPHVKVMIFEDHSEPVLRMAVSKASSFLGATDVHITDKIEWDLHYNGRYGSLKFDHSRYDTDNSIHKIYSQMADVIFVSTQVSECVKRFACCCEVPVVSMRCRKHSTLQSLATFMSLMEDYGSLERFNLAYVGAPHQVLNDYLILCAMFKVNFKFKCCCKECGISPLLLEDCKQMCEKQQNVTISQVREKSDALSNANAIIAGPTVKDKDKIDQFHLNTDLINKHTKTNWTFYHTFPRGPEVDDDLFWHCSARTFNVFRNMQYIAAASMAFVVRDYKFGL